jgi:hypothetical protein
MKRKQKQWDKNKTKTKIREISSAGEGIIFLL